MDCYELIELLHSLEIIVKDNLLDLEGEKDKEE